MGVVLIPLGVTLLRLATKAATLELRIKQSVDAIQQLVQDKDRVHQAIVEQMKEDRKATNERLQYLEREVWGANRGGRTS